MLGVALQLENGELHLFYEVVFGFDTDSGWNRCVRASLFGSFGQLDGTAGIVKGTDEVSIEYTRSTDGLSWTQ